MPRVSGSARPRSRCTSRCYAERNPANLQVVKVTEANLTYVAIDRDGQAAADSARRDDPEPEASGQTRLGDERPRSPRRRCDSTGSPGWKPSSAIQPRRSGERRSARRQTSIARRRPARPAPSSWRRASPPDDPAQGLRQSGKRCIGGSGANTTWRAPCPVEQPVGDAPRAARTARCDGTWSTTSLTPSTTTATSAGARRRSAAAARGTARVVRPCGPAGASATGRRACAASARDQVAGKGLRPDRPRRRRPPTNRRRQQAQRAARRRPRRLALRRQPRADAARARASRSACATSSGDSAAWPMQAGSCECGSRAARHGSELEKSGLRFWKKA